MNFSTSYTSSLMRMAEERRERLVEIASELIRRPSENVPPGGAEEKCQRWLAEQLAACGLTPELYTPDDVPGLKQHRLFRSGRVFTERPNLTTRLRGSGGGRSLLLSGHIDTVPRGTQDWTRNPFGADREGNYLYGRGASDMKAGVAASLFMLECLAERKVRLKGDLVFETVVDEEFGGGTGTLAARVRGDGADAAILTEPSNLRICPAQRGGRVAHLHLRSERAGVLDTQCGFPSGVIPQLSYLLNKVPEFAAQRRSRCVPHLMYTADPDPVPVTVTKVHTSPWGWQEPLTTPEAARLEIYWQLMPGEKQAEVEQEFLDWLDAARRARADLFPYAPEVSFPIRWLPGSAIRESEPLVTELAACSERVTGKRPIIAGIEGPCDLYLFHEFGIPAVLWGPRGGNIHAADEYVDLESLFSAALVLLRFCVHWCGVAE